MKKLNFYLITGLVGILFTNVCFAQPSKELTKQLKTKALKSARKEAKSLEREGYYVAPGSLPLDKQLETAWSKQIMSDETGYPLYIIATGNAFAETQTVAKFHANELAKFELAGTIQTNVAALIDANIANAQLKPDEATSVTEVTAAVKNVIVQEIGRVIPLVEIYKKDKKGIEASIRIAYNSELAKDAAKKILREELMDKTKIQHEKLDKLLNF